MPHSKPIVRTRTKLIPILLWMPIVVFVVHYFVAPNCDRIHARKTDMSNFVRGSRSASQLASHRSFRSKTIKLIEQMCNVLLVSSNECVMKQWLATGDIQLVGCSGIITFTLCLLAAFALAANSFRTMNDVNASESHPLFVDRSKNIAHE